MQHDSSNRILNTVDSDKDETTELIEATELLPVSHKVDTDALTAFHVRRCKEGWKLYHDTVKATREEAKARAISTKDLATILGKCTRAAKDLVDIERKLAGLSDSGNTTVNAGVIMLPAKAEPASWDRLARLQGPKGEGVSKSTQSQGGDSNSPGGGKKSSRRGRKRQGEGG